MNRIPSEHHIELIITTKDATPGSNFFFVVLPNSELTKYGSWKRDAEKSLRVFLRFWFDRPVDIKIPFGRGYDSILSNNVRQMYEGAEAQSFLNHRTSGKNDRLWLEYDKRSKKMRMIEFRKPTPEFEPYLDGGDW